MPEFSHQQIIADLRRVADAIENGAQVLSAAWGTEYAVVLDEDGGTPMKGPATFTADIKFGGPI